MIPMELPETVISMTPATGSRQNTAWRRVGYSFRNSTDSRMATTGATASTTPANVALVYRMP